MHKIENLRCDQIQRRCKKFSVCMWKSELIDKVLINLLVPSDCSTECRKVSCVDKKTNSFIMSAERTQCQLAASGCSHQPSTARSNYACIGDNLGNLKLCLLTESERALRWTWLMYSWVLSAYETPGEDWLGAILKLQQLNEVNLGFIIYKVRANHADQM